MAVITTNAYNSRSLSFEVWETGNYSATNSTREYGWKLYGSGSASGYQTSGNFYASVGGNDVYYSSPRIQLWQGTVVAQGTVWVQHDNDGSKYVNMYCEAGINKVAVNCTASGGFWGSNVPRYANITSHSISHVGINKVGVSWGTDVGIDLLQYSLNGGAWTDVGGNPYYVGGLAPNTAYNIRSRVRRTDSGLWTESGYLYFTTVNNAVITGANDFTDEGNGYMAYNNAWGNNIQQLVGGLYWNGSEALREYADISKTGTEYTFTLSEAERSAIRSRMANVNTMDILYYIRTKSENLYYYSTVTKKITITNAKPVIDDFEYQDVNEITKALTRPDNKIIIKNKSNLRVYNIFATTLKAATKKTVIVDGVGATWSDTYEKTIDAYSKNTISVSMTDSRNNTADLITKTFDNYIEYFDIIKGEQSSLRGSSGVGENVTLVANGTWFNGTFGSVANTLTASYRYKKTGSSTWITGTTVLTIIKTDNNFTINQEIVGDVVAGFNVENSYDLELILTDKLSTATFQYTVLPGSPAIAILGNKIALGGKLDEVDANFVQIRKKMSSTDIYSNGIIEFDNKIALGGVMDNTAIGKDVQVRKGVYINPIIHKYRYIRIWSNGSSSNRGNHIVECMAYGVGSSVNLCAGKTVTSNGPVLASLSRITDGINRTDIYADFGTDGSRSYAEIDLGAEYEIEKVRLWRYFGDGRTYYQTALELITGDRSYTQTLHNYLTDGTYQEQQNGIGKTFNNPEYDKGIQLNARIKKGDYDICDISGEAWATPVSLNGWIPYNDPDTGEYSTVGYKKINGIVYLRGLMRSGTWANTEDGATSAIFNLPVGYRPKQRQIMSTYSDDNYARVDIFPNGNVSAVSRQGNGSLCSLSAIRFPAEQ